MPRKKQTTKQAMIYAAMEHFWFHGYEASSMADLIAATKTNRQAIYADFGGKKELFLACMVAYSEMIVSPAFEVVEETGAGLQAIEAYFETQISKAEAFGLPGPGCLIANTMTERGPHDVEIKTQVAQHNERLSAGFLAVLETVNLATGARRQIELEELAFFLTVSAQGLWSMSRAVSDANVLRVFVRNLIYFVEVELNR